MRTEGIKREPQKAGDREPNRSIYSGYQWGDPPHGQRVFSVTRRGERLAIAGAMPNYSSESSPFDLLQQYEIAHKSMPIGKQRTGKDSPHIRFANAQGDEQLIEFVSTFGPVVADSWKRLPLTMPREENGTDDWLPQVFVRATQDLRELRSEQQIYQSVLGLLVELSKNHDEFNYDKAKSLIGAIAHRISAWPNQWKREKKALENAPRWGVRQDSLRRIEGLATSSRSILVSPKVDARIVIAELVNMFPSLVFPNRLEMHSHIRFGIRPLLYSIVRKEFLSPPEIRVCLNTQCRSFFRVERAGQLFCDDICSRQHRQREYWKDKGAGLRKKRLAKPTQ